MEKNEYLEDVSEKIRHGIPVSMTDAISAIDYQSARREFKKQNVFWRRFIRWIRA